jgi:streptomycin 6-kinase
VGEIEVDRVVQNKAVAFGAEDWLQELDELTASLARDWALIIGPSLPGGTEAVVLEATMDDGTPAVLKLGIPRQGNHVADEALVLRLAGGEGCARLFLADLERGALLIERLGPSMFDLEVPYEQRIELLCDTASALWRPAPESGLRTGATKGQWLAKEIERRWNVLDRPCTTRTLDYALTCAARRVEAHDDERAVLAHGDVHQWNALQTLDRTGFKLVDPDGLLVEPEYDLGILMREDPTEGDLRERARFLATRTGCDETAIWEWGVVERLSTALLAIEIDLQPVGDEMLAAAERVSLAP